MQRYRSNKHFKAMTMLLLLDKRPREPWPCVAIEYTWHSSRRTDLDNITAACKPILDGIVHAGVIADDSPHIVVRIDARWKKSPRKEAHVRVSVMRIDPPQGKDCTEERILRSREPCPYLHTIVIV